MIWTRRQRKDHQENHLESRAAQEVMSVLADDLRAHVRELQEVTTRLEILADHIVRGDGDRG